MRWTYNDKNIPVLEREYRRFLLVAVSSLPCAFIVGFFLPKDQEHHIGKTVLVASIGLLYIYTAVFWSRSKMKKSGVPGSELYAYWLTKPLSKIVHLVIAVLVIVDIFRAIKGKK